MTRSFHFQTPCFKSQFAIFPKTNYFCLLIVLIAYWINSITFGFLISALFSKTKAATISAYIVWYLSFGPYFGLEFNYDQLPGLLKWLVCLLPNTAISFAFKIISRWEQLNVGLNWTTAFETSSVYDSLSIVAIFSIFIINSILLFLLTLYVENVFPGRYGVAKRWNFIFKRAFWLGDSKSPEESSELQNFDLNTTYELNFESEPRDMKVGIEIRNITKRFTSDKAAVDNLSLNIYENQITCLLGQNGAGKTTTISMLTGMIQPTSGTALIDGHDIRTHMDAARDSMGFCPQHNILFDELTVREHILFYSCLKGNNSEAAEAECKKYLPLLELEEKKNALTSTLSGGMKRKLSVVIALCGNSKIVYLDEPTSGMDPSARRSLWDILLAEKEGRAILLTTHFMDEADVLSDRIAILANGKLKCSGSTFFLKKRFGTGYHLILEKLETCNSDTVTQRLQVYIPEIRIESENENELTYLLPENRTDLFKSMFQELEKNASRLSIPSFGVSLTTLEEVFLRIAEKENLPQNLSDEQNEQIGVNICLDAQHEILQGWPLLWSQTTALFKKRYICWLRIWPTFCGYNLIVILLLALIIYQSYEQDVPGDAVELPPLNITFDRYKKPFVIVPKNVNCR